MIRDIWNAVCDTFTRWSNLKPTELPVPCPVCGYKHLNDLDFYPADYNICGRCGVEFGSDDFTTSHQSLWRAWVDSGQPWFDPNEEQAYALKFPAKRR